MELNEKTLASELAFDGVLLKLYRDQVELADGRPGRGGERVPGAPVPLPLP